MIDTSTPNRDVMCIRQADQLIAELEKKHSNIKNSRQEIIEMIHVVAERDEKVPVPNLAQQSGE